jgi:RNA recognition motif-containing protein
VTSLNVDVQEDHLRKVFEPFGDIRDICIRPKDNFAFAFINYYEMDHANRAISECNGVNIGGKRIKCDLAKPRGSNNNRGGNAPRGGNGGNRPQGGSRACFKCN